MKAVIKVGGKQYIVTEKQTLLVDLQGDSKELSLEPLMVFDGKEATVGTPVVKGASVKVKIVEAEVKGEKIQVAKFQAKKRVKKVKGHRQKYTKIEITKITA
jgi:large subunit ribosomal protein L21